MHILHDIPSQGTVIEVLDLGGNLHEIPLRLDTSGHADGWELLEEGGTLRV